MISPDWQGLVPISVLPEYHKQGIGKSLVNNGLSMLKELGGRLLQHSRRLNAALVED
jgi:predicted N-acetyltransferase YhbS